MKPMRRRQLGPEKSTKARYFGVVLTTLSVLFVTAAPATPQEPRQKHDAAATTAKASPTVDWAVRMRRGADADQVASALGFVNLGQIGTLDTNPGLFSTGPSIEAPFGDLTFTPSGAEGTAAITLELRDDGGTANGGDDTSPPQSFTISASSVHIAHDVGFHDPSTGQWHLRDNATSLVTTITYGNPLDVPIVGDWNCDGTETVGLFRLSDAFFYLRFTNTTGIADLSFFAGNPSDIPLAGDFDGDGCGDVALYRPSTQQFFIFFSLPPDDGALGTAPVSFLFGNPGDTPVVGDWDGDHKDEVGLYRESAGFFYWRNTLTTGIADGEIFFGNPGDLFVAGDWGIVDWIHTPAVFRGSDFTFYFKHDLNQGVADSQFFFGLPGWRPVAGIFGL